MKLHDLVPNEGSKKNRKRVGRGIAAGQGKTAGRGAKGQKKRSGSGGNLYRQGGNLPFFRRLPPDFRLHVDAHANVIWHDCQLFAQLWRCITF